MKRRTALLLSLLFLFPAALRAQGEEKPFVVHSAIGDTLRRSERDRYQLLPAIEGFRYALFSLNPDSTLRVRIRFSAQGTERDTIIARYRTLASLRRHIDKMQPVEKVTLKDGSVLVGILEGRSGDSLTLRTEGMGSVRIATAGVERIEPYEPSKSTAYESETVPSPVGDSLGDPNSTRAFIMPSAQTLPAGHGYIADYELFLLSFGIALNDHLMVNGGMLLYPSVWGEGNQVYNFGIRVGFGSPGSKVAVGFGAQFLTIPDESPLGLAYGVVSFGDAEAKISLGAGVAFETRSGYSSGSGSSVVGAISGESCVSRSVKLLAEVWILPEADFVPVIIGVRFFGGKLSGDLGLLTFIGIAENSTPFPVVNLAYNF